MPIMVGDRLNALQLAEVCVEAGMQAVEITCRRERVKEELRAIKSRFPDLIVLVGSIVEEPRLLAYLRTIRSGMPSMEELADCGADGFVSQYCFRSETLERYADSHLLIPGVETVREATEAIRYGAHFVKFVSVSPERIGQINSDATHRLFPIFYTGGITVPLIAAYLGKGAVLLGGGWDMMLGDQYIRQQDNPEPTVLHEKLMRYVSEFRQCRTPAADGCEAPETADDDYLRQLRHYHPFA
jgi:2-dehydro-3-deoxyphosphogluconate aldolase/(4S)-4-hydroxy-2-oxoglutarate aldolase